jgi:predicted RNA-binding protein with RPS1 domain
MATIEQNFETIYGIIQDKAQVELDAGRIVDAQYASILGNALIELIRQSMVLERNNIENTIKEEQWNIQKEILEYQRDMTEMEKNIKQANLDADLVGKQKKNEQLQAEIDFTVSRQKVMEWTRKDNARIKAASEFSDFLKYISAANAIPATEDFKNIRNLIIAINDGVTDEDAVATLITTLAGGDSQAPL